MDRSSTVSLFLLLLMPISLASAQSVIGGVIGSDTNLPADTYHLTSDLTVTTGVTLTLSPGVVIKSDAGRRIVIDGALVATGTSLDPIVFTEARDSSVGLPVTAGDPAPGAWDGVEVRAGGNATLEHARIRYTGNSNFLNWSIRKDGAGSLTISQSEITLGSRRGLVITGNGGSVSLSDSLIADMGQIGVLVDGSDAALDLVDNEISNNATGLQFGQFDGYSGTLTMTGNQVTGNSQSGLYITGLPITGGITGNTFTGNDQNFGPIRLASDASGSVIDASNTLDGPLRVDGGALAAGMTAWANPFTYRLAGEIAVLAGSTLNLPPGTVVKADVGSRRLIVDGDLNALGTVAEPVVLTEIRDDSAGGDSGFAGDPAPGSWNGVEVRDGGSAILEQVQIRYTGNSSSISWALRKFGSGSLTLRDSVLSLGSREGLRIGSGSPTIVVENTLITGFGQQGVEADGSSADLTLTDNQITGNALGLQFTSFQGNLSMTGNQVTGHSQSGLYITGLPITGGITGNTFTGNDQNFGPIRLASDASGSVIDASNTLDGPLRVDGGALAAGMTAWANPFTYRLAGEIAVLAGSTLNLPPGTVVKADVGSRRLIVDGDLNALGTVAEPVVLTEIRDDSAGGDSGFAGDPAPGSWNGVEVRDGGSAILEQVQIRYTGNSSSISWALRKFGSGSLTLRDSVLSLGSREGLRIGSGSPTIVVENTLITGFGQQGVEADGSSADLTLTDNQITGNALGLQFTSFQGNLSMTGNQVTGHSQSGLYITGLPITGGITGNTFTGNDQGNGPVRLSPTASATVIDASNTLDGPLRVDGGLLSEGPTTWANPFTYRLAGTLQVPVGATLDLSPGTVVKVDGGTKYLLIQGQLDAVGTSTQPIVFTDLLDDSAGGDSGFPGDPSPGSWRGIDVQDGAAAILEHIRLRYAGASTSQTWAIRKSGAGDLLLGNSVITLGARDGVVVDGATGTISLQTNQITNVQRTGVTLVNVPNPPSLTNNRIMNNGFRGVLIENASPVITGGRIAGNGEAGVWVSGADSAPEISGVWISGNAIGVDSHSGANPLIGGSADKGNDLVGNTQFGVRNNDDSLTLNARFNWWGDASGPLDPIANPDGLGDPVSAWVDYGDFLDRSAFDDLYSDRFETLP